jgi:hypothetical protein
LLGCNTPPPRRRCSSSGVVTAAMAPHHLQNRACKGALYRGLEWGVPTPGLWYPQGLGVGHRAVVSRVSPPPRGAMGQQCARHGGREGGVVHRPGGGDHPT